jgi:hypothetical protein
LTRSVLALGIGLVLLSHASAASAQAPGPVTLTLRLADNRRQFRPGEIIRFELTFESTIPRRFVADGATYDRSGRLTIDEFRLAPIQLVTDPMLDYFATVRGYIGGGLRSMGPLGEKPFTVTLELNDWFRFDTPGTFTLAVRSSRVSDETQRTTTSPSILPVESNAITFEVLPRDPRWEDAELRRALQLLSEPRGRDSRDGCRILRFLGTRAAVDEMIRRFADEDCQFDFNAGMFVAPDRAHVVDRLEAGLRASEQPVTETYLRTLATLSVYAKQPALRPAQTADAKGRLNAGGELSRRPELVQAELERYAKILASALPLKTATARAVSAAEYAAYLRRESAFAKGYGGTGSLTATPRGSAASAAARQQLVAAFPALPELRQRRVLEYEWGTVAGTGMLPVLRGLADGSGTLADLALRRLYELAPEEGRPRILAAISQPYAGATLKTLGALPDAVLPELDGDIARRIELNITDIGMALLYRYASPAVAPRMLQRLGGAIGRLACIPQTYALAYFLHAAPQEGPALLDRAFTSRDGTGCYQSVLHELARLRMTPELEARAIAALDDEDLRVVQSAVALLGRFGSPAAVPALRSHFDGWQRQWRGRASELRYNPALGGANQPGATNAGLESAYLRALGAGQGWLTDARDLSELRDFCVTDSCRTSADALLIPAGETAISIFRFDGEKDLLARLAQYEFDSLATLGQKLSQYPAGTTFTLQVLTGDIGQARAVTADVTAWAAKQGFSVRP